MHPDLIIDVRDLTKSFGDRVAVDHIALSVKRGEVFGFLGPNGSGKTTTIRMLCGLLIPDQGQGHCMGYDLLTESYKIKQKMGYMTQNFSFYTDLSVEENLNFMAQVYGLTQIKQKVKQTLQEQGLYSRRHQLTQDLSGGWKQRMALAACLLHQPELLLLDEPTAGIDPIARRDFWDTIHALSDRGMTTLMSTHYMDEAERCTRLAYIAYGKLIITGTVDDVISSTNLHTWELRGEITTRLLQAVKRLKGVTQAVLFGRQIHVCGLEKPLIEAELQHLSTTNRFTWVEIESTLEDAFINLVSQSHGDFS